jgi:hypothetical protein
MKLLDALVEQRIAVAAARSDLKVRSAAPTSPNPDEDLLVPAEVRAANRLLKSAGFVPPAAEQLRALCDLPAELQAVGEQPDALPQPHALALDMALESLHGGPQLVPREYCRRIATRLSERTCTSGLDEVSAA